MIAVVSSSSGRVLSVREDTAPVPPSRPEVWLISQSGAPVDRRLVGQQLIYGALDIAQRNKLRRGELVEVTDIHHVLRPH